MEQTLAQLRLQIDALDGELVALLAKREAIVHQVLTIKKANNIPARITWRVDEVINNATRKAEEAGASPDLARTVWTAMVDWFCAFEAKSLR
jgi:isochorismate pyruvate lyase